MSSITTSGTERGPLAHGSILSPEHLSKDATDISMSETAPLNPAIVSDTDLENEDLCDLPETEGREKKRGPLYILIMYRLSFIISVGGQGAALRGYGIIITVPFDEHSKKDQREGYKKNFWEMQSIVVLVIVSPCTSDSLV
jgi:hypothetical protein